MTEQSEKQCGIVSALAKAKLEMPQPKLNKTADFTTKKGYRIRYKYADLGSIIEASEKPLCAHGIVLTQTTRRDEGKLIMVTTLRHSDGGYIESEYPVNPTTEDPQAYGSALTYARRYQMACVLGLAAEEDDDGHRGSTPHQQSNDATTPQKKQEPQSMTLSDSQIATINNDLRVAGIDKDRFWTWATKSCAVDLPQQIAEVNYMRLLQKITALEEQQKEAK